VSKVSKHEKIAIEIIEELDTEAREIDHYEYGLPIYNESDKSRLVLIILRFLTGMEEADIKNCLRLSDKIKDLKKQIKEFKKEIDIGTGYILECGKLRDEVRDLKKELEEWKWMLEL